MGYHIYLINETKKQIVDSKVIGTGLEIAEVVGFYLSQCKGDTFRIVGEEAGIIEREVFSAHYPASSDGTYNYINLYLYDIHKEEHLDRLVAEIHK